MEKRSSRSLGSDGFQDSVNYTEIWLWKTKEASTEIVASLTPFQATPPQLMSSLFKVMNSVFTMSMMVSFSPAMTVDDVQSISMHMMKTSDLDLIKFMREAMPDVSLNNKDQSWASISFLMYLVCGFKPNRQESVDFRVGLR